jgi:hypothetical protein
LTPEVLDLIVQEVLDLIVQEVRVIVVPEVLGIGQDGAEVEAFIEIGLASV